MSPRLFNQFAMSKPVVNVFNVSVFTAVNFM